MVGDGSPASIAPDPICVEALAIARVERPQFGAAWGVGCQCSGLDARFLQRAEQPRQAAPESFGSAVVVGRGGGVGREGIFDQQAVCGGG